MGGRRIGKTSFLLQLHDIRLPSANIATSFLDSTPDHAYDRLAEMLPSLSNGGFLVLLLDEADNLVGIDRGREWSLFAGLRALANSGRIQVVLSGEKTLRQALRDPSSPFFNFVNEILLGPLNRQDVNDLVTRPMKQLEIEFVDEQEIVNCVWDFTSGHPNVVQRLCRRLVERLNDQGTRRITLEDVQAVTNDPGFQREDFLSTYWERATLLEKIISLLMANDEKIRTLREVRNALDKLCHLRPMARQVQDALQDLVDLRSILKENPTGYEFAIEAFPRVVAGTMTLDAQLQVLAEEYQEQGE
jgi:hypothetical protein